MSKRDAHHASWYRFVRNLRGDPYKKRDRKKKDKPVPSQPNST